MQVDAADELHVVVAQAERALAGFAHGSESLGQQVIECFALAEAPTEFVRLGAQGVIGERLEGWLERVDLIDHGDQLIEPAFLRVSRENVANFFEHALGISFIKSCQTGLRQIWQLLIIIA